jgi:hypothetical protein
MKVEGYDDTFAATFLVEIAPDKAWPLIARKVEDKNQSAADSAPGTQVYLPGWEMTGVVLEATPGKTLKLRKDAFPCKDTIILIDLEAAGSGTRVRVVQSGFGIDTKAALNTPLGIGADFIFTDFALYLETNGGVMAHRHMSSWAVSFGADVKETPAGLVVLDVPDNTFAARAGLKNGDRLLTLAGAAIITWRDLVLTLRTQAEQERVQLYWARGNEKMSGYGTFQQARVA